MARSSTSIVRPTVAVAVGLFASSCASYQPIKAPEQRPRIASVVPLAQPVPTPPAQEEDGEAPDEGATAGELLERGFFYFHRDQLRAAAGAFSAAIATGHLNDAGRALAYWHISLAQRSLQNEDQTAEALSSFVVAAEDVLDLRRLGPLGPSAGGDFVEHFDLANRVAEARAYLSAAWARRVPDFGRSSQSAVPVNTVAEAQHFLRLAPPCREASDRVIDHQEWLDGDDLRRVERVKVACESDQASVDYFLIFLGWTDDQD